ncbi:MAG: CPBP family intramembrane metalloprotease [Phycisphaerales bacterium]|nr:CPBP family intramembrane metalloprotease [Phycisphaerales bacterium]
MDTQQPAHDETRPIRWGVVALIALIAIIGTLGPKLLWMSDAYRNAMGALPIDLLYLIHPLMRMTLVLFAWVLLTRMRQPGQQLTMGLGVGWGRALKGLAIGFGCTLPMLALGLLSESFTPSRFEVLHGAISPGLTEEIFYRALLFGMLVQLGRFPLWWSAIISAIVFGLAHIDITPNEGETIIGQLNLWNTLIALGGFMYAWLYFESRWNLWVVIALHAGMNLWWDMFDLSATPLGGWGATLSRIAAVGLVVLFVVGLRVFGPRPSATIEHDRTPEHA